GGELDVTLDRPLGHGFLLYSGWFRTTLLGSAAPGSGVARESLKFRWQWSAAVRVGGRLVAEGPLLAQSRSRGLQSIDLLEQRAQVRSEPRGSRARRGVGCVPDAVHAGQHQE